MDNIRQIHATRFETLTDNRATDVHEQKLFNILLHHYQHLGMWSRM